MRLSLPATWKPWQGIALLAFFAILFLSRILRIADQDVFFHSHAGWWMLSHLRIPYTDTFSLLGQGRRWINHQWLSEVFIALLSAPALGGFALLSLARALCVVAAFLFVARACMVRGAGFWPTISALTLAALASWPFSEPRPYIFTYLLLAFLVWAWTQWRERGSDALDAWRMPVLFALWANLHGGFVAGIAFIAASCAGQSLDERLGRDPDSATRSGPTVGRLALLAGASILAACINPNGPFALTFFRSVAGERALEDMIQEWNPPAFEHGFWPYYAYLALLLVALLARPARIRFSDWLPMAGFVGASIMARRHIPLMLIATAPVLAEQLQALAGAQSVRRFLAPRSLRVPLPHWREAGIAALLIFTPAWGMKTLREGYVSPGFGIVASAQPVRALAFLQNSPAQPELLHAFNWGGYVAYAMDEPWRPAIDGRVDVFGPEIMRIFEYWMSGSGGWRDEFVLGNINTIALDYPTVQSAGDLSESLHRSPDWARVYWDDTAIVYARRTPEIAEWLKANEYVRIDPAATNGGNVDHSPPPLGGKTEGAEEFAQAMAELDRRLSEAPDCVRALDLKSEFLLRAQKFDESLAITREIVRLQPRLTSAHLRLAQLHEIAGKWNDAEREYRRALALDESLEGAVIRLGTIEERRENLGAALAQYRDAMRMAPADAAARINAARVLARQSRTRESLWMWEPALPAIGRNPEMLSGVAELYGEVGATFQTWQLMQRALAAGAPERATHTAMAELAKKYGLDDVAAQQEKLAAAAPAPASPPKTPVE